MMSDLEMMEKVTTEKDVGGTMHVDIKNSRLEFDAVLFAPEKDKFCGHLTGDSRVVC
jgi:hypothetical protein